MPETPLPQYPNFDFFAAPDVSTDRNEGDELDLEYTYPKQPETVTRVITREDVMESVGANSEQKQLAALLADLELLKKVIRARVACARVMLTPDAISQVIFMADECERLRGQVAAARAFVKTLWSEYYHMPVRSIIAELENILGKDSE